MLAKTGLIAIRFKCAKILSVCLFPPKYVAIHCSKALYFTSWYSNMVITATDLNGKGTVYIEINYMYTYKLHQHMHLYISTCISTTPS